MAKLVSNKKAYYHYEIIETYEAGIKLLGTEIKSLRNHGGNLDGAFCKILDFEMWLLGASIVPYKHGAAFNHEELRDRKLLMHKKEILKISQKIKEKGLSLIPLCIYLKKNIAKIEIALVRGKKKYDKRHAIKEREEKRRIQRITN
ncbi:MAG: SsrA-binding protein [Chlamydiae bacterium]|nr:SsrA-binding protein [Chlamydiota bacterium]